MACCVGSAGCQVAATEVGLARNKPPSAEPDREAVYLAANKHHVSQLSRDCTTSVVG
jgi:hypothetical protein